MKVLSPCRSIMPTGWLNDRLAKALEPREYFYDKEWVISLIRTAKDLNLRSQAEQPMDFD